MSELNFKKYKLSDEIIKAIDVLGYSKPTKVQSEVMPYLLEKKDLIIKSETGSGKTAAFAIPICELLEWDMKDPQTLVITPTRELALQIKDDIFNIGRFKRIKVQAIFGKASFEGQQKQLQQRCHVVVGTPGRLIDHVQRGTLNLDAIKTVVIDEADEMLKMGFIEQIETLIDYLPDSRNMVLLSATMPEHIESLCNEYMREPKRIDIESADMVDKRIQQVRYLVSNEDKMSLLGDVLVVEHPESCIIFANMKTTVDDIVEYLRKKDIAAVKLHGGMEQKDRTKTISDFKHGYFRYLVATDVAARGLDIDSIPLVVNYDLPRDPEVYTHRIGRSARHEKVGKAISLMNEKENKVLKSIITYSHNEITFLECPTKEQVQENLDAFKSIIKTAPVIKKERGLEFKKEIMKLHINAGKKTKMRAGDVVGAICNIPGVSADDIGVISIVDVSTFVEIVNNKGQIVYNALQSSPIKGRIRKVSKANTSTYEDMIEKQSGKNN
jgi:superfamily II DNA/RNA helicase